MKITSIYDKYFQKSKIFLYPLLDIKRGTSVVPQETYIAWNEYIKPEDMKLVTLYFRRDDTMYKNFEEKVLLKHPRLTDYWTINEKKAVFVFDFQDIDWDWNHFLDGNYSLISVPIKNKIKQFFQKNSGNALYVDSYLYPSKFFKTYAEILDVHVNLLKSVGELCDKPNIKKETLLLEKANLENIENSKINY